MPKYSAPMISLTGAQTWSALQTFSAGLTVSGGNLAFGTSSAFVLDAANTLALRNGTNAQAFSVYNTWTDASNYERAVISWSGNILSFGTDKAGTGVQRRLQFVSGGAQAWFINAGSQYELLPNNNNTSDLGAASNLVRSIYIGTSNIMRGSNGQFYTQGRLTELVAVGSGLTTKATTIQIPADAIVYAVPVYVKTKPGGTATMTVTATTSGTAFQKGANISTNAGTSDPGAKNTPVNYNSVAAQTVTFTFDAPTTDALGEIRVDIYYATSTPPTS